MFIVYGIANMCSLLTRERLKQEDLGGTFMSLLTEENSFWY